MPFPLDERYITATEEELGVRFPRSFREKMLILNGGEIWADPDAWELHPFWDQSDKKRLSRTCNDIVRETKSASEWPRFPPEAISIGVNGCGDHLIFMRDPKHSSTLGCEVYWWDHETGEIQQVANDFADLRSP